MNRIREFREGIGMPQKELAHVLSIAQGTLSGWENGTYPPNYKALQKMSELFGKSIEEILNSEPNNSAVSVDVQPKTPIRKELKQTVQLSEEALQLAQKYMLLNPSAQAVLRTIAEYELRQDTYMRTEIEGMRIDYQKQLEELRQQIPEVQDMTKEA